MIYYRHKETGFVVSHKDLKEKYDEVKEELLKELDKAYEDYDMLAENTSQSEIDNLISEGIDDYVSENYHNFTGDDFEILVNDENLEAIDYIRLMNILESSIITDHDLIKKIRPIIQKKINIEKILNKF